MHRQCLLSLKQTPLKLTYVQALKGSNIGSKSRVKTGKYLMEEFKVTKLSDREVVYRQLPFRYSLQLL